MAHTAGPWRLSTLDLSDIVSTGGTVQVYVATIDMSRGDIPDAEVEANARLIAAAPDMLAALKTALAWYEPRLAPGEEGPICNLMSAAISKAEGTTAQ